MGHCVCLFFQEQRMAVLFLTGSSGGLGRAIRAFYLKKGWKVVGFDAFDDKFVAEGYSSHLIDSTSEASVQQAFATAIASVGIPDQLIATIGGLKPWTTVDQITVGDFKSIIDLNLLSTFISVKQAVIAMKNKGSGSIVTIGADTALHSEPKKTAYIAAKSAVIAFTQAVAEETKDIGITANVILPKVIHTKANEEWGSPEEIPRWTEPSDIASFCFYLASAEGKAINGAMIRMPNKA